MTNTISQDEAQRAHFRSRRMYQSDIESAHITAIKIGQMRSDAIWEVVVAEKDAELAANAAELAANATELAANATEIARLRAELEKRS